MNEFEGEEANSLLLSLGNILLTPNQDINKLENIIDLINIYNIETRMNSILVSYNELYDLYYNEINEILGSRKFNNY